jgi:hypothetical protein
VVEPPAGTGGLVGAPIVAARVFAFSDSQLHYLFGKRTFAQSPFADMSVEVAIRPVALDDGSDLLLSLFLDEHANHYADHTLVFLGDAADLSCEQEYAAFFATLERHGITELMSVTSNHDGFFVGNFTSQRDLDGALALTDMPHDWTRACSDPGSFIDRRLTKGRAIAWLERRLPPGPGWSTAAVHRDAHGPDDYKRTWLYYLRPLGGGDPGAPPVWGVFLDTVDYRDFDLNVTQGAGTVGQVSKEQLRFVDVGMLEARHAGGRERPSFIVFGHYPFGELSAGSRKRLGEFFDLHPEVLAYVSAHAHVSKEQTIRLPSGRRLPELVVGSTTDAPQTARQLEVHVDRDTGARALASWRLRLDPEPLCGGIERLPPTTAGYTGYRILRDSTPTLDISTLDKLMVYVGIDDLEAKRVIQGVGALLVENELVRGWAQLYLDAPPGLAGDRGLVRDIVGARFAAGDELSQLRPWLTGAARVPDLSRYDRWHDPVVERFLAIAERAVHRFGPHREAFERLRRARASDPATARYFLCHAAFAAEAEESSRRTIDDVVYIR